MSGNGGYKNGCRDSHSAPGQIFSKFFEATTDALFGGVLAGAHAGCHLMEAPALEKAQEDGIAIPFAELSEGILQQRSHLRPGFGFRSIRKRLHKDFLFALKAPDVT